MGTAELVSRANAKSDEDLYYHRFTLGQRYLHAGLATSFLTLAFTGMTLRFSTQGWAVMAARLVGGFAVIQFFHLFFAVILTSVFLIHVGDLIRRMVFLREKGLLSGPNSMVVRRKDFEDFFANMKYFLWLGPLPKFDRYAYWEKLDYWGEWWGMGVIGLTGYAMWFPAFFARFIPGRWLNVALVFHSWEALLAAGFIFLIHFFNAHLRPLNFPMDLVIFTGRQSEEEFKIRHPVEYERIAARGELERLRAEAPPRWMTNSSRLFGLLAILAGFVLIVLAVSSFVRG
jgi:cytochrome b subunit of formate dehydrogenase